MPTPTDGPPCVRCGRLPSLTLPIRRHVGMVFVQQFVKVQQPLCRDHGREITRAFLGKTLWQGWWGLISFFFNWFVVVRDVTVLVAFGRLDPPSGTPWANRPGGVPRPVGGTVATAAWHPDPTGRHQHRWHDGAGWTARVADDGVAGVDPLDPHG